MILWYFLEEYLLYYELLTISNSNISFLLFLLFHLGLSCSTIRLLGLFLSLIHVFFLLISSVSTYFCCRPRLTLLLFCGRLLQCVMKFLHWFIYTIFLGFYPGRFELLLSLCFCLCLNRICCRLKEFGFREGMMFWFLRTSSLLHLRMIACQ